jgi:hypothetical protein
MLSVSRDRVRRSGRAEDLLGLTVGKATPFFRIDLPLRRVHDRESPLLSLHQVRVRLTPAFAPCP